MPDDSKPRPRGRRGPVSKPGTGETPAAAGPPDRPLARVVNLLTRRSDSDLSATRLLANDRQVVRALLRQIDGSDARDGRRRRDIVGEILRLLDVHTRILSRIFQPACRDLHDLHVRSLVAESNEAHRIIRGLVREIGALSPFDEKYEAKVAVLARIVLREWAEEEQHLFADLERAWPLERLEELGARLRGMRARLATAP